MVVFETDRLCFRELTDEDYGDVASVLMDDAVMQKMSAHVSAELVHRWLNRKIEQYRTIGYSHWHVSLKATGAFVGIIGIAPEKVENTEYTGLGYLIRREYQQQGYGYEGAHACLNWAFRELHPAKVIAEIADDNPASRRLAEKLGMRLEKTYLRFNGESEVPYCLYSVSECIFCPMHVKKPY